MNISCLQMSTTNLSISAGKILELIDGKVLCSIHKDETKELQLALLNSERSFRKFPNNGKHR